MSHLMNDAEKKNWQHTLFVVLQMGLHQPDINKSNHPESLYLRNWCKGLLSGDFPPFHHGNPGVWVALLHQRCEDSNDFMVIAI